MCRRILSAVVLAVLPGVLLLRQGAAAEDRSWKKARAEQARLQELVRLAQKAANPAALAPHFKKLAEDAVAEHVCREASYRLGGVYLKVLKTAEAECLFDELSRSGEDVWFRKAAVELGDLRRRRGRLDQAIGIPGTLLDFRWLGRPKKRRRRN